MRKIILLGYMGSGKSVVGEMLAARLCLPFLDLDHIIEVQAGQTVSEIFATRGEIQFRRLEHEVLSGLVHNDQSFVLSLGGGTPCYAYNHLLLTAPLVTSFYLRTGIATLKARLLPERNQRPLIANLSDEEFDGFIGQSLFERSYYYNQATNVIDTDGKSTSEVASAIATQLV